MPAQFPSITCSSASSFSLLRPQTRTVESFGWHFAVDMTDAGSVPAGIRPNPDRSRRKAAMIFDGRHELAAEWQPAPNRVGAVAEA
jgi:hypothetical protein